MRVTLTESITRLQQGEVVAIPTETVYGLAADARNDVALKQIFAIKERPANNPLIVHIGNADAVTDWASEYSPLAQKLAKAFWPGPFTLVLPAKDDVSNILRANEPTVALRVPAHSTTQQLLQQSGLALAAPSANKYTQLSPTTPEHVEKSLGADIAVLDGGACQVGIESTIVSVINDEWQLLRHGMITEAEIEAVAGQPAMQSAEKPKAPGQHLLHYSPKTPVQLFASRAALLQVAASTPNCALLLLGEGGSVSEYTLCLPVNAAIYAEKLYDTLHQLDAFSQQHILIELPPQTPAWLAIHDRLMRASDKLN